MSNEQETTMSNEQETTMSNERESQMDKPEIEPGTRVYVDTIPKEEGGGVYGVVCRASDGLQVAQTEGTYDFNDTFSTLRAASKLAGQRGWVVVDHVSGMRVFVDVKKWERQSDTCYNGVVRRASDARKVAETGDYRDYDDALREGRRIALRRGWVVVDASLDE